MDVLLKIEWIMRSFSYILFLSLICNFAYGQAIIKGINYDESKVPDFVLPDPLICNDGQQVTTADEWEKVRRPEILEIFMSNVVVWFPIKLYPTNTGTLPCTCLGIYNNRIASIVFFPFVKVNNICLQVALRSIALGSQANKV